MNDSPKILRKALSGRVMISENLTGASVYCGHDQIPAETPSTAKSMASALTTHNLSIVDVFSAAIDAAQSVICSFSDLYRTLRCYRSKIHFTPRATSLHAVQCQLAHAP